MVKDVETNFKITCIFNSARWHFLYSSRRIFLTKIFVFLDFFFSTCYAWCNLHYNYPIYGWSCFVKSRLKTRMREEGTTLSDQSKRSWWGEHRWSLGIRLWSSLWAWVKLEKQLARGRKEVRLWRCVSSQQTSSREKMGRTIIFQREDVKRRKDDEGFTPKLWEGPS